MGARGPAPQAKAGAIRFRPGVPPPPDHLDADAVAEYVRAAEELEAADASLQQVDFSCLAAYAQAYSDVRRLTLQLRGKETTVTPQGEIASPLLRFLALAERTRMSNAAKLGFSPADRARVPKSTTQHKAAGESLADI